MTTASLPAEFTLVRKYTVNRASPARWIVSHSLRYWPILLLLIVGAYGNGALAGVVPRYVGQAFDDMLASPPNLKALLPLAFAIGISQIVRGVLQFGRNFGAELMAQKIERDIRDELYLSLLGKSMTFHNLQPVGDTMARATNDVREVNFMFSPGLNLVIGSFFFIIVPLYASPAIHPALLLVPVLFTVGYFIALANYLRTLSPVTDDVRATFGKMNTHLSEALDGVETMKGAAQEEAEIDRFVSNAKRVRAAFVRQGDLEARFLPMLLLGITYAAGLFHALLLYRDGAITVGHVVAYFGLLRLLDFPTFASIFAYSQISLGLSGARRILDLINRETDLDQNAAGFHSKMRGDVEFSGVCFEYNEGEKILEDIAFKVRAGQTVAVVGQTGAGKTSLVKLINRTYDAPCGHVRVDGVDVREWNLAALRQQISIIEQDIFLFSRSIADNIAFGKPGATREEIEAAAKAAQAHEFILTFEQGYDTVIGERGATLSGGQRQRLALARAFLTDPRILILDDSTSAIDSATEDKIQRAISAASRGRTTFIITHRLSQIRWADLIVVLRKGRVAAIGSHEELMKSSEAYSRIFRE
ncbi:MAG: ABC transporter [Anaerolineaceae bacterium]|jgi:ATP-binding cassette subfamily B protein|nr:ABC transporter ATP-binding protein [Anaerolineae bacterium]MBV6467384.1 putative multidrug export ATP-binding/permease protein [Anaerolineales bacterium]MDL1925114.1 ABC transporter ATP-binding protein [Anaerolineae bacterium AMX1]GER78122.1 ABC transporter ATP-binding protein [Candidatus Denitrolinea symbiosum]GIK10900.1 MAG: ABC transporter [Chloroflexota bacterium]GJQ38725.1 MAG: ABC transporter [Anaerolineaceae bacterium]